MKLLHVSGVVCPIVATCLLLAGCERSQQSPLSPGLTTVKVGELPELDDPIGSLDQQRIDVSPPKGWYVPSRSSRWIIRFAASQQARYPSIIVRAEDYAGILDVSQENVGAFAEEVAAAFEKDDAAAKQSMTIAPIEIGRFVGVTYRRRGRAPYGVKEIIVDRLLLETVVAGRKYTLELQTRDGDLERYRGYLFAVAAGIKFLKAEPGGTPLPPEPDSKSQLEGKDQV